MLSVLPILVVSLTAAFSNAQTFAIILESANLEVARSNGFTNLGLTGCDRAVAESRSYTCKNIFKPNSTSFDDFVPILRQQLESDSSIVHGVYMGIGFGSIAKSIATTFPKITFSIMDQQIEEKEYPSNVQGIYFGEDEPGYLAGVLAGAVTNTSVVGVIGGNPVGPVQRYVYGFLNGVKFSNPAVTVLGTFSDDPTWGNTDLGVATAESFLTRNADVLFGAGGALGSAAIAHFARASRWAIGVDTDESRTTFANRTDVTSSYLLTSALKNVDQAMYLVLKEKIDGRFQGGKNKKMDAKNGGVGLAPCVGERACAAWRRTVTQAAVGGGADGANRCGVVTKPAEEVLGEVTNQLSQGVLSTGVSDGVLQGVGTAAGSVWSSLNGFGRAPPGLIDHTQTLATSNTFLFYGGVTSTNAFNRDLYMYSIDTTNWTSIAPPASSSSTQWPPAMQGHGAVFRKATEELYIVGGTRQDQSFVSEVWKWSMRNMAWEVVSTIGGGPVRRKNHAVAMVDDKFMFVWGGQDDSANIQNDLWRLDLTTSTWSQLTPAAGPTPPASSFSNLLALSPTSLLLFGGNTGTRDLSTLHIYSITSNTWSPIFSSSSFAPPALSKATGVVLDARRIMIVGGNSNGDMKNGVYIFNHVKEEWTGEAASSKLPYELQGMTSVAFKQSDSRNACEFTKDYDVCKPDNRTMLLMYGGTRRDGGSISGLLATFPPVEPEEKPLQYVQTLILSIGYTIAGIGIILSILSLIATLIYRKTPAFRSASPTFLTLYALGALCAFGGIIAYNLPVNPNPKSASSMTCRTGLWMFSEGCMLVFSAMVVKNWRIHFIFMRSRSSRVAVVKDGVLIAVVAALMIVNTGVLSAFSVMSPYEIGSVVVDGEVWPICTASKMGLWLWILIAPPGLVLLYGVFVSFSTRNVTSKFNESFQINLAIYATVLSLIVLVPLSLTIKLPPTLHVINSLLTCLTLCTVIGSNFFAKTYNAVFKSQRVFDLGPSGGTGGRGTTSDEGGETTQEEVLCCRTCTQPLKQRMSTGQNLQLSQLAAPPSRKAAGDAW